MSFGIEVYTGAGRRRFSSNDSGVVPPKLLYQHEYRYLKEVDNGKYYIDIGTPAVRAKNAFITVTNYNFNGAARNGLPSAWAKLLPDESYGNVVVVSIVIRDGTWSYPGWVPETAQGFDCQLWVLGV